MKIQPGSLVSGKAYYRVTYADPRMTVPGIEPMIYVGENIFPGEPEPEPRYYFQDTASFHEHGSCVDYSGPMFSQEETPFNVYSFTAGELGTALVSLPEAIQMLTEANERGNVQGDGHAF